MDAVIHYTGREISAWAEDKWLEKCQTKYSELNILILEWWFTFYFKLITQFCKCGDLLVTMTECYQNKQAAPTASSMKNMDQLEVQDMQRFRLKENNKSILVELVEFHMSFRTNIQCT